MRAARNSSRLLDRRKASMRQLAHEIEETESRQFDRDYAGLDDGIRTYVKRLRLSGIETFESCEGGPGHSYPEPTVRFSGTPETGWRALAICLAYGLPVLSLRREWDVLDANEVTGPYWAITFRVKSC
ncbi:MAG TPA: hypothetical protein VFF06_18135 [Polyangia bacterium]|nr:hypothetical protein [Polyangia bacterium]